MYKQKLYIIALTILAALFIQCSQDEDSMPPVDESIDVPVGRGHQMLSDYHFFVGPLIDINPNETEGVLPYDLNVALFSDYASKKRFVYVPEGLQIELDQDDGFIFPVGAVMIKHFYFPDDVNGDQHIETRLFIKRTDDWQTESYIWNEAQTDAERTVIGDTRELTVLANGEMTTFNYLIPNQNQCKNCHDYNNKITTVGPNLQNLNKDFNYSSGTQNQLLKWISNGIIQSIDINEITPWYPIEENSLSLDARARAYLDVNCASCHSRTGSAENSGLYLEFENQDSLSLGFLKTPVAAGDGSGGFTYVIKPGDADRSILLYRMIADAPDERMPEIGRELLHDEGIALIREWIDSME